MDDCIFCRIAQGTIEADKVYEDDTIIAFNDINPKAPTHILLIPKKHIENLNAATSEDVELLGRMLATAAEIARNAGIADSGWRLVANSGPDSGQEVPHLHLHILGGRPMSWPPG